MSDKLDLDLDGVSTDEKPHSHTSGEHQIPDTANYRQGTSADSCANCVFFENGICDVWDSKVEATMVCDSHETESHVDQEEETYSSEDVSADLEQAPDGLSEFYSTGGVIKEDDGLVWKPVLRTGTWKYRPGPGQKPIPDPLKVIKGRSDNPRKILGLEDIYDSFKRKAIEHITIPTSHQDRVDENTGYVKGLKIEEDPDRPGESVLVAGLDFTDPDIKSKIKNGSIANTSVGLFYDYIRKDDGEKFGTALAHIALTNRPWINGMKPFGLSELEKSDKIKVNSLEFSEEDESIMKENDSEKDETVDTSTTDETVDITNVKFAYNGGVYSAPVTFATTNANGINFTFAPQEQWQRVDEVSASKSKTSKNTKETPMSEIPGLEGLQLAEDAALKVSELLSERNDELAQLRQKLDLAAEKERIRETNDYIDKLKALGLSEQSGFLKEVRRVLLADDKGNTLNLSEDGKSREVTMTDVVKRLIDALPKKSGKINFGEQVESLGVELSEDKPAIDTEDENKSDEDRYEDAYKFLYGKEPVK